MTVEVTVLSDTVPTVRNRVLGCTTVDGLVIVRVEVTTAVTNLRDVSVRVEHTVLMFVTFVCFVFVVVLVVVADRICVVVNSLVLDLVVVVEMLTCVLLVRTEPTNAIVVKRRVEVIVRVDPIT